MTRPQERMTRQKAGLTRPEPIALLLALLPRGKWLILPIVVLASIGACGQPSIDMEEVKGRLLALEIPTEHLGGQTNFEANCLVCHGELATGSLIGPPLVHSIYRPAHHADVAFSLAVLRGTRAHHWRFGDMQPVPDVTPEMVEEIIGYIRWLQRQEGIGVGEDEGSMEGMEGMPGMEGMDMPMAKDPRT